MKLTHEQHLEITRMTRLAHEKLADAAMNHEPVADRVALLEKIRAVEAARATGDIGVVIRRVLAATPIGKTHSKIDSQIKAVFQVCGVRVGPGTAQFWVGVDRVRLLDETLADRLEQLHGAWEAACLPG